ncbi:MAG TPA: IS110 family transposase [Chloroflexota bacterium]|nr:IS110 family transposase [Chloroflexota bacterium]
MPAGQQVEVDEHEQIVERVAAIDVAKTSGMVCTRVPHATKAGKRSTRVWQVGSTTNQILELAEQLAGVGIERVVVESTSDYWRPFVYLLEARGLPVWLVNARDVKHLPGRPKTDKLDAVWLCKLNERGMLRPSFVPPAQIRRLRDYTRLRADLTAERSRHKQRLEKLLEDALIKLGTVATDIFGVSGRAMLEALIAGERDPKVLAELARGRLRVKHAALVEALTGQFSEHHAVVARMLLDQIDALGGQIEQLTVLIEEAIAAIPAATPPAPGLGGGAAAAVHDAIQPARSVPGHVDPQTGEVLAASLPAVDRLDEVAGIGRHAAQVIIAEVGLDMGQFPTPGHLVSWARLSPRTIQSGARHRGGATGKGNPYLKAALGEAATAAAKTDTFLGERYRRLVRRIGKLKALVAIARSILVIVWHLLADPTARFHDLGADYYTSRIDKNRKTRSLVHQLEALGHRVTLEPAA